MTDTMPANRPAADCSEQLVAAVAEAASQRQPVYISAGGSKRHILGRNCDAAPLDVSAHSGIIDYQPSELVLTARAGTPLVEILETLHQQGQTLPCEPPLFGGRATLGGTLACNLSGPARPWGGSIRDLVLGLQLINGRAERLNFGGKVMKNVAGYDVSRLQAGAQGTLGVITQISLKVLPLPQRSLTLAFELSAQHALDVMHARAGKPGPLSAACWQEQRLYLRLQGADPAVEQAAREWGGQALEPGLADNFWSSLRDMSQAFFNGPEPLWRFSVNPTAAAGLTGEHSIIDWCGAQRWLRGEHSVATLQQLARGAGGNVSLFAGGNRDGQVLPTPDPVIARLQLRLKQAFDPAGIFNPGRLYRLDTDALSRGSS
jgi:glycolate oxidase FAD binding subunit